ncbi:hypothetical protein LOD99_1309 [Oopsacas minuta]|uniref:COMMD1 N-terminal domain-containing protein n=1 Tax=Oopsacas minuta TaxID=111878 RepID=A0AAV7K703_9METZ|nr:hypothetical protein LOD99_1309 [Oopsacas minuta]
MAEKGDVLAVYLTELSKVLYDDNEETQEMEEYANQLGSTNYEAFKKRYTGVLQALVSVDMDFTQLTAYLTSQKNKRQVKYLILHVLYNITTYSAKSNQHCNNQKL